MRKIDIDTTKLVSLLREMCSDYNKEHPEDPIVSVNGCFYLATEVTETHINLNRNIVTTKTYRE